MIKHFKWFRAQLYRRRIEHFDSCVSSGILITVFTCIHPSAIDVSCNNECLRQHIGQIHPFAEPAVVRRGLYIFYPDVPAHCAGTEITADTTGHP
jgi:hypothetical protein